MEFSSELPLFAALSDGQASKKQNIFSFPNPMTYGRSSYFYKNLHTLYHHNQYHCEQVTLTLECQFSYHDDFLGHIFSPLSI